MSDKFIKFVYAVYTQHCARDINFAEIEFAWHDKLVKYYFRY